MKPEVDLPFLTFETAVDIGIFPEFPYTVRAEQVTDYAAVTGDANPLYAQLIPPGFAGVFGRTSYLQNHRMPPGGILLRQDITWHRPALIGVEMRIQARLIDSDPTKGRLSLTFETTAMQGEFVVCTIILKAGWPQ